MVVYWNLLNVCKFEYDSGFSVWFNANHDGTPMNGNSCWLIPTLEYFDAAS